MNDIVQNIIASVTIEAPRDHVWDVMTGEASVPQWLGCMNYKRELGSVFHMQQDAAKRASGDTDGATHCELIEMKKPERFVFSWYFPGTPKTHVRMALEAIGDRRTRVTLKHDGWEQFPAEMIRGIRDMLAGGWTSHVLPNLKKAAEGG